MALKDNQELVAKEIVKQHLDCTSKSFEMMGEFRAWYNRIVQIQMNIKKRIQIRKDKLRMLEGYFDQERKIMVNYYSDKGKKKSKVKSPLDSLKSLEYNKKFKYHILSVYYGYKIISQNLLDAVYYSATVGLE